MFLHFNGHVVRGFPGAIFDCLMTFGWYTTGKAFQDEALGDGDMKTWVSKAKMC